MRLSKEEILRLGVLARLDIGEEDVELYAAELSRILELVAQMSAVDTEGVEPMAHPSDLALRLREDEVTEGDRRAAFQAIAPETEAGLYLVPKVIE